MRNETQVQMLQDYLEVNGYITPLVARAVFGIERLASRIYDLRKMGVKITVAMARDARGKRYTRYYLGDMV